MSEPENQHTNEEGGEAPAESGAGPPSQDEASDAQAGFLGFLILGSVLYFTLVFTRLPEGYARWIITGAVAAGAGAIWLAAMRWAWVEKKLPVLKRKGQAGYDFLIFAFVVVVIVLAAIYLAAEDKVVLLKIFAVVYFSLLPALLYLQFSSRRTLAVWRDFVCNLYKLRVDDPANLPRPPTLSRFHQEWRKARDDAWKEERVKPEAPDETREQVDEKLEDRKSVV